MAIRLNYNKWNSPYIYHIIAGNKIYIGQSADMAPNRIYSHFRATYYKEKGAGDGDSERKIHDEMQKHRIQEVQVEVYDNFANFGIANFDELVNTFLNEWEPVVTELNMERIRLDLAEIFHIQWALQSGYELTNTQMGGVTSGWAIKGSLKDVDPAKRRKKKVLLKTFKPDAAAIVMTTDADDLQTINDAMRFLFDVAFDDTWPEYCASLGIKLNENNKTTWSQFFGNKVLPKINELYTEELKAQLYSEFQSTRNSAREDLHQQMYRFIKKEFVTPREDALRKILKKVAPTESWGLNLDIVMEGLDWFQLASYIAKSISNPISALNSSKIIKTGKNAGRTKGDVAQENLKNFKPANFLANYRASKLKGNSLTRGRWLRQINIRRGNAKLIEDWKRNFSLLLFNRLCEDSLSTNPLPSLQGNSQGVVKMTYSIPNSEWLSTRVHTLYKLYAPGYDGVWWEFYRPMVVLWREKRKSPQFVIEEDPDNEDYMIQYWIGSEDRIEYRMGSTAVFEAREDLMIY